MKLANEQMRDVLAAEYVIGTLRGRARNRFDALMKGDDDLRRRVQFWEDRLADLQPADAAVAAPVTLWPAITQALGWGDPAKELHAARPWRAPIWLAWAFVLVAAVGVTWWNSRGLEEPFTPDMQVAIADEQRGPMWTFNIDTAHNTYEVVVHASPAIGADQDLELWLLQPGDAAPLSLGVLPEAMGARKRVHTDVPLGDGIGLAVSVEPVGGSPTGSATGPIIYIKTFS